ncbi:hypothetical protein Tco_0885160 [Tanacetum coccineum]
MDDEPMWTADHVVALTPGSAITIPETANEFSIKGNHLTLVKGNQFDGRTKTDPHKHIHEFLGICDMFKYRDTENEAARLMMFPISLTGEAKTWEITQEVLNATADGIFLYKTPNQAYQLLVDLLSEVALTEEAQYEEVCKKSLRDFHKTRPSGSRDEDDSNNDHEARSEGSDQESDSGDDNTQSDKKNEEVEDDEDEKDDEFITTSSNSTDDEDETNVELKVKDKAEGDEDEGMDYTTNQVDDDVDLRMNEPVTTDEGLIQKEGTDAEMINVQQGNENLEITLNQVIKDAYVTLSTVTKKTEVPVTSSSHSSDLASEFLKFSDIPHTDAEIISPMDVHVHHEVPSNQKPTLLTVCVSVIIDSSPVYSTVILQSLPSFTYLPQQSTLTPPPTTEETNPLSTLLNFASVFQFNNKVTALENEVAELKKGDPLNAQVTALVDKHLDSRLGATRDKFMNYLSASITARITEQVNIQLPYILPKEVYNFAPPEIKRMVTESLEHAVLANESSQPKSTYEDVALLTEFELKKILIDKIDESQSYLIATEHRECYDGLIKSYDLDKSLISTYDKSEEQEFEVADSDMPQDQEENLGNDDEEPKRKVASKRDWITKPKQHEDPIDPDWNVGKTPQQGPTQSWLMTLASSADKPSKTFDELISTPIDFSAYIMNSLKITNLTQETLLGPVFKLLKGTCTNYAELEYDFKECYKGLSKKLDWDNPKGGYYPFDLTKPLPLVMNGNCQMVPVDYFFKFGILLSNTDIKVLQGGILLMTYTTSITKQRPHNMIFKALKTWFVTFGVLLKSPMINRHFGVFHIGRKISKTFYGYADEA